MERVRPLHLETRSNRNLLGGIMGFDGQMINLLMAGNIAGAKALITTKYPGISKYRVSMYINAYRRLIVAREALRQAQRDRLIYHQS